MAQELIYTSVPRGIRKGSSGFCTVACTSGMAPNYIELLESLSGYTAVFPPHDPKAGLNPLSFSHYRYTLGGKPISVLSRVAFAGVDHTQRSNKFASHLVLDAKDRIPAGPAWLFQQENLMATEWNEPPGYIKRIPSIPPGDTVPAQCNAWKEYVKDAGWAGVLAQSFLDKPRQPSFIIFEPGMDILPLIAEAIQLMPHEQRWNVTFNTYFSYLPMGTTCIWRCCLPDSPMLKHARRMANALVLDLTAGSDQPVEAVRRMAENSPLIECARTGEALSVPEPTEHEPVEASVKLIRRQVSRSAAATPQRSQRLPQAPQSQAAASTGTQQWQSDPTTKPQRKMPKAAIIAAVLAGVLILSVLINLYIFLKPDKPVQLATSGPKQTANNTEEDDPLYPDAKKPVDTSFAKAAEEAQQARRRKAEEEAKRKAEAEANRKAEAEANRNAEENAKRKAEEDKQRQQKAWENKQDTSDLIERIAKGEKGLADIVRYQADDDGRYLLALDEVSAEWEIKDIGTWDNGELPGMKKEGNGYRWMGKDQGTAEDMQIVNLKPVDGGLQFERNPKSNWEQLDHCLANIAWIEVYHKPQKKTLFILTKARHGEIKLKRDREPPHKKASGKVNLPPHMARFFRPSWGKLHYDRQLTDSAGYRADIKAQASGAHLIISVTYNYQMSDKVRAAKEALQEADRKRQKCEREVNKANTTLTAKKKELEPLLAKRQKIIDDWVLAKKKLKRLKNDKREKVTISIAQKKRKKALAWAKKYPKTPKKEQTKENLELAKKWLAKLPDEIDHWAQRLREANNSSFVKECKANVKSLETALRKIRARNDRKIKTLENSFRELKKRLGICKNNQETAESTYKQKEKTYNSRNNDETEKRRNAFCAFEKPLTFKLKRKEIARYNWGAVKSSQ